MLRKLKGTNIFKYIIRLWSINGRLHKEALKQAATDPKTGIIDVGILTTGVSTSERQRRELLAKELRKVLQSKSRGGAPLKQAEIFEAMKEQSQAVRGVERVYYTIIIFCFLTGHHTAVVWSCSEIIARWRLLHLFFWHHQTIQMNDSYNKQ